ncbi:hypothetical protein PV392_08550 [Streptomyces sp. ME03-5709C]|nr:hypothetical protein [Streptomyces sp. ME03-5709C]
MTEQTHKDDVKIPAQSAGPAEETLRDVGSVGVPSGEAAAEPSRTADAEAEAEAVDAAAPDDGPAEPAPTPSDDAVTGHLAVDGPAERTLSAEVEAAGQVEPEPEPEPAHSTQPGDGPAAAAVGAPADPAADSAGATSPQAVAPAPRRRLRDRRGLRAAVRWTAAVVAFAALGGAAAYAVTQPERTEVPGLRTPDDGRWTYPALKLPKLPAGAPPALDEGRNPGGRHHADLRTLLLPLPRGAKRDTSFPDRDGWLPTADFLGIYPEKDRKTYRAVLEDNTLRHIAARAWTMPDGTRTEIYLVQFITAPYTATVRNRLIIPATFAQAPQTKTDTTFPDGDPALPVGTAVSAFDEAAPRGAVHLRAAYITSGDTLAVIHMERPKSQPVVPFDQAVLLQAQLLG